MIESFLIQNICEIFQSIFFKEHLRTTAPENMKLRKIKTLYIKYKIFQQRYQKQVKMYISCFNFMVGFLWSLHLRMIMFRSYDYDV